MNELLLQKQQDGNTEVIDLEGDEALSELFHELIPLRNVQYMEYTLHC